MHIKLLHSDMGMSLIDRLLDTRKINDTKEDFLSPTFQRYRTARQHFSQAKKATERIHQAMKNKEKIMIFGDYDVDGILSSFVIYTFFRDYLDYHHVSLRLPHRVKDGYGIKKHHLDEIHATGTRLVITVDNGITAVQEAAYAKELGIDLIITDHHKPLDKLPDAYALINPQCEPDFPFKQICGAVVAAKFCLAIADQVGRSTTQKYDRIQNVLPYLTIATIADCMPLIGENRLIVKKGLQMMNNQRDSLHQPLQTVLEFLNLKQVDSFHIAFVIAPRLNATGRVGHAFDGLKVLLTKDPIKQREYLEHMDSLNTTRKKIQDQMVQIANEQIDTSKGLLRAASTDFHEGIIGIVAGRITEKYSKPSLILSINEQENLATGSLRGPERANIVTMLQQADTHLLRYGGHAQAGGLTVHLDQLPVIIELFEQYCQGIATPEATEEQLVVDTQIYTHELDRDILKDILSFGPYGEAHREPLFLFDELKITHAHTVGKSESTHLKLKAMMGSQSISLMYRGKGALAEEIKQGEIKQAVGKIKEDTFNGGRYIDVSYLF